MSKRYPLLGDKEWLYQKYLVDDLTPREIGEIIKCARVTVTRALKALNIPLRTLSESKRGKRNPNYGKHMSEERKKKALSGEKHPMYGKPSTFKGRKHTKATIEVMSEIKKGKNNPFFGKMHTLEARAKMSHKGKNNPMHGKHHTDETKDKIREKRKHRIYPTINTIPERLFINFYHKFSIEDQVEDTRDNSFHVGKLNPDFIIRDKRVAIFINGDYWHSPLLRHNIRYTQRVDFQIAECKRHNWKAVIIWETDLKREDAELFVHALLIKEKII